MEQKTKRITIKWYYLLVAVATGLTIGFPVSAVATSPAAVTTCVAPSDVSSLAEHRVWEQCMFDNLGSRVDALATPAPTVTVTATTTETVTASPTSSNTTEPTTSTTTTPSTTTTTTAPVETDWTRPTAATTGYSGTLSNWGKSTTFTANNQTISNVDFGGYVKLTGSNIVLDNCHFDGLVFYGPGPLTVKNCTSNGAINTDGYYRNIDGVTFNRLHVIAEDHDGIDLFSSANGKISNVSITDSLIDGQTFPSSSTAHGDGLQVRGVNGLTVERTVFDMYTVGGVQPQKNAAIYFEDVWGGDNDMHFTNVDLIGGDPYNHTFYTNEVTNSTATNVAIKRGGYTTRANPSGWVFDNVTGPDGSQISP